ncbi:L-fucose mutarotase [Cohnella sp. AR92]|uniref:L-fucose mutarotase n=1 Tax=Cohnella sp. AR92 TaxID=648716 RepID=UPI000F8C6034|nr:L-fucose mutarotase [Cohnella sp. AR92]RUS48034.1 L-fucose mutarotase [Cohnella sp. AR92]
MLKGISSVISPELLKILMEMGHGDEIVLADANFPTASHARNLVRADGHRIPELLQAILQLMPLDPYVDKPAALMQVMPGDRTETPIWREYGRIVQECASLPDPFEEVERFAFYERAKRAYAIVATGEGALYANLILKKGVISQA